MNNIARLRDFVTAMTGVVDRHASDRPSISIHVYGGNIGAVRRHVFDAHSGEAREFISGYHNTVVPNLWDRSAESAAR